MSFGSEGIFDRIKNHRIITTIGILASVITVFAFTMDTLQWTHTNSSTNLQTVVQNINCGEVISHNVVLTSDMNCRDSDGMIVANNSLVIDLNGFTIAGPDTNIAIKDSNKVGIGVPHLKNIIIKNGTKRGFQAGILVSGSSNVEIQNVVIDDNENGIFSTGSSSIKIEMNDIRNNKIGVGSYSSTGNQIHGNNMTGNDLAGVTFVNTDSSKVDTNSIGGSRNGIFLDAQSTRNTILYNNVLKNDVDINNADGLPLNINGNELLENNCFISRPKGPCNPQIN